MSEFLLAAPPGYGRSWSSDAADDENELLQMMDNLEDCLSTNSTCELRFANCLLFRSKVELHAFYFVA